MRLAGVARGDRQPRHGADRRQRLAAEAERADRDQIVVGELRGGVAFDRERQIGARHALAVIADADQPAAAAVGEDVDAARAGIERVLDQLLDHARRTLDHLAGGDAVDDGFGKLADGHDGGLYDDSALTVARIEHAAKSGAKMPVERCGVRHEPVLHDRCDPGRLRRFRLHPRHRLLLRPRLAKAQSPGQQNLAVRRRHDHLLGPGKLEFEKQHDLCRGGALQLPRRRQGLCVGPRLLGAE